MKPNHYQEHILYLFAFTKLLVSVDTAGRPGDTVSKPGDTVFNPGDTITISGDTVSKVQPRTYGVVKGTGEMPLGETVIQFKKNSVKDFCVMIAAITNYGMIVRRFLMCCILTAILLLGTWQLLNVEKLRNCQGHLK